MILRVVLKSGAPGLLEGELDHDSIALGPSDAEFEADEAEQCEATGEETEIPLHLLATKNSDLRCISI